MRLGETIYNPKSDGGVLGTGLFSEMNDDEVIFDSCFGEDGFYGNWIIKNRDIVIYQATSSYGFYIRAMDKLSDIRFELANAIR